MTLLDLRLRTIRLSDEPALLNLWNRAAVYDPLSKELFREKVWADPGATPELRLLAEEGDRPVGFVIGAMRPATGRGFVKMLAVTPSHQRQQIGSRLLEQLEAKLREAGATSIRPAESAPNYLTPGIDVRYQGAERFFERNGYIPIGNACNMRVELSKADFMQPAPPRGAAVRRCTSLERPGLMDLLAREWPSWTDEAEEALRNDPPTLFVAVDDHADPEGTGEVVGFAAYDANNRGTGWFGPMGTDPRAQGRGLGRALLLTCLAEMAERGVQTATIPWVGPTDFYAKTVGARIDRLFLRMEKH